MDAYDGSCFFDGKDLNLFRIAFGECEDMTLRNASKDLSLYIEKAYGIKLNVVPVSELGATASNVIFIGSSSYDTEKVTGACKGLCNNGIAIVADKDNLYLTGKTSTGAMYAVYTFLEDHLGWRFYSSSCERLIKQERILLPKDACITYSPKLLSRDTFWFDTFDLHFAAKRKINGGFKRSGTGYGELIKYAGGFVHTLPDLAGTERVPNAQPCLTDPEVFDKVLGNVRRYLDSNKDAKIISVSQNDSYADGLGCQCEKCKAIDDREGTPMGSLLTFVNRIADAIKDDYPDVLVDTLAYRYTRKAPKTIKPRDNVIIRLCSIECCFSHSLDADCPQNVEFKKDIEEWSAICNNLFIWDYTTDFLFYLIPFPNFGVLYDNVRFFVNHNAIGLFEQGNGQSVSGEFGELRAYMLSKIMWNPDMTKDEWNNILVDALQGFYGAAWRYVKECLVIMTQLSALSHMGIYDHVENNLSLDQKNPRIIIEELEELFKHALRVVDSEHYENVEKASIQVKYTKLLRLWDNEKSPEELKEMYGLIKKYGITHFREGVRVPENPDFTKPLTEW